MIKSNKPLDLVTEAMKENDQADGSLIESTIPVFLLKVYRCLLNSSPRLNYCRVKVTISTYVSWELNAVQMKTSPDLAPATAGGHGMCARPSPERKLMAAIKI